MNTHARIMRFLPFNDILPKIGSGNPLIISTPDGYVHVKSGTNRLICLAINPDCVCCGARGQYFLLEENSESNGGHLNLYAEDEVGELLLLTVDHIIPKSHGGSNDFDNLQTMCSTCNAYKKDLFLTVDELRDYIASIKKVEYYNRKTI